MRTLQSVDFTLGSGFDFDCFLQTSIFDRRLEICEVVRLARSTAWRRVEAAERREGGGPDQSASYPCLVPLGGLARRAAGALPDQGAGAQDDLLSAK